MYFTRFAFAQFVLWIQRFVVDAYVALFLFHFGQDTALDGLSLFRHDDYCCHMSFKLCMI